MEVVLETPQAQHRFGADLGRALELPAVLYLEGDLGAGKTTLARGLLAGRGHQGSARSPTYTLIEPYELPGGWVYHLDLYRLGDPEELEYLGLRDLMAEDAAWLIEWPERGAGLLPKPDLRIQISYQGTGRRLTASFCTPRGQVILGCFRDRAD